MLKNIQSILLFVFCIFINPLYSQKAEEPRLVGTWTIGYEDYGEFIYHRVEEFRFSYLKDNPNSTMVVRLCSKEKMSGALVNSYGFAFNFPDYGKFLDVPADRFYFARWSGCAEKSEQYWFVPENSKFEYDELIPAENVQVRRWLGYSNDKPLSQSAENKFEENTKSFITELTNDTKAEGFIICNLKMKKSKLKEALRQIQTGKIDKSRFQIIEKRIYESRYPEFMTVSIND